MKKKIAMIFAVLMWAEFAYATDVLPRVRLAKLDALEASNKLEHVSVVAPDLSDLDTSSIVGTRAGLSDVVLYHEYDILTDSWKFVGTDIKKHKISITELSH